MIMKRYCIAMLCLILIGLTWFTRPVASQAQASDPADDAWAPLVSPVMVVPRATGSITIDGKMDEAAWKDASRTTNFTEVEPGDQTRPSVRTEVSITYDDANLYVAFRAYDRPSAIRASLRNRDEIFQDDWVGIILDPYGDATRAYEIFANPLGIQGDLQMSRQGENVGFDLIYDSAGQITEYGYTVEMAIPFKSLRFPKRDVHEWNITFLRNHPRSSRHIYSWASVSRDNPCLMCQFGTITGISDINTGRTVEIIPAVVGTQSSTLADEDDPTALEHGRVSFQPSLNLRYNLTSSLAAEATINPDFSQVESDAAQIDVNSTFALFYPERRPFFQEGGEMFDSYIDVVYTRSINSPLTAAKVTGQPGRTSIGIITALDERTPILIPLQERSEFAESGKSFSTIVRGRHAFGTNSYVGGIVSDRRYEDGGSGTAVGVDGQWQFLKNYQLQGQFVVNRSTEPDDPESLESFGSDTFDGGKHTVALDGESFNGHGTYLSFDRDARTWSFDVSYRSYSPTFRAANGFVTRNDYRNLSMMQYLQFYPETFVETIRPMLRVLRQWNHAGEVKEDWADVRLWSRLRGQTQVFMLAGTGRERFRDIWFDGLWRTVLEVNSDFSDPVSIGGFATVGRTIARNEDTPQPGDLVEAGGWMTLKPLQRLVIRPRISYARLQDVSTGEDFFDGVIVRTRADLLFTRELSLRLIGQYNSFSEAFTLEPLLSYRLNAYSVAYVGSSSRLASFDDPFGYATTDRQFFFKLQYLLRT